MDRSSDPSPLFHVAAVAILAAVATLAAVAAALGCSWKRKTQCRGSGRGSGGGSGSCDTGTLCYKADVPLHCTNFVERDHLIRSGGSDSD